MSAVLSPKQLPLRELYRGKSLMLLGGTGFLGKVFWCLLLTRFPDVKRIYLVVRSKRNETSEQRFWSEIASSEALQPLRDAHGDGFEAFLREKIEVIDGDVGAALCGVSNDVLEKMRGDIDAVVNVAGVVDFNPPLDEALHANAFGAQNLVALCKSLGDVALFHTSTCYVVGEREGLVGEAMPGTIPFPRAGEIEGSLWNAEREVEDGLDIIREVNARAKDGFRQSEFVRAARTRLEEHAEPVGAAHLADEAANQEREWVRARLRAEGESRAKHWGWPNTYTYTKSIGEQLIAHSGLPFVIARPACCESTLRFPFPGWNEGIGTSAPIIYAVMKGQHQLVAREVALDFIPADLVCVGMTLALAELFERSHKPVYHFGAADVNPATSARFAELIGIYKRKSYAARWKKSKSWTALIGSHVEATSVSTARFEQLGPPAIARTLRRAASWLSAAPAQLKPWTEPARKSVESAAKREERLAEILRLFTPFTYAQKGPFDCTNTREAYARVDAAEREGLVWDPEHIDWADYWMRVHMPAMEHKIIPWMDARFGKSARALRRHDSLEQAWAEAVERHRHSPALGQLVGEDIAWTSYAELDEAGGIASLTQGVEASLRAELVAALASLGAQYPMSVNDVCVTVGPKGRGLGLTVGTLLPLLRGARVIHTPAKDPRAVARVLRRTGATALVAPASFWNSYAKQAKARLPKGIPGAEALARVDALLGGRPRFLISSDQGLESGAVRTLRRMGLRVESIYSRESELLPLARHGKPLPGVSLRVSAEEGSQTGGIETKDAAGTWRSTGDRGYRTASGRFVVVGRSANFIETRSGVRVQAEQLEAKIAGVRAIRECVIVPVEVSPGDRRIGLIATRNTSSHGGDAGYWNADRALRDAIRTLATEEQPAVVRIVDTRLARIDATGEIDRQAAAKKLAEMALRGEDTMPRSVRPPQANRYALAEPSTANTALSSLMQEAGSRAYVEAEERLVRSVIRPQVFGATHIPHNRSVLVVANHASHLDAPLVRFALGEYGAQLVVTAAADYFFEGKGIKQSLFSRLSHVAPVARASGAKGSLDDLLKAWSRGAPMLVFPEGTRATGDAVSEFRPLIGQLVQRAGMDVLPVYIRGASDVLPKGARLPRKANVSVRIGPCLSADALLHGADGLTSSASARLVADRLRDTIVALSEGRMLTVFPSPRPAADRAHTRDEEQA